MKKHLSYIIAIGLGLVLALFGFLLTFYGELSGIEDNLINLGLGIAQISGFILLLKNGVFLGLKIFRFAKIFIAVILIGVLFKLMHWPLSTILLSAGVAGLMIVYSISFFQKKTKLLLDYLKLLWVAVAYIGGLLKLMHLISDNYQTVAMVIMLFATLDFLKNENLKKS